MKAFAGIVFAGLSIVGLAHQNTIVRPPAVAVTFPKAIHLSPAAPLLVIAPIAKHSKAVAVVPHPVRLGVVLGTSTLDRAVTQSELQAAIQQASNGLRQLIYANAGTVGQGQYSSGGYINNLALTQRIDNLSNVTISNPTVTGTVLGLTAASIPALSSLNGLLGITQGGTGTSTAPAANRLLLSDANGNWEYTSTTTLGITGGGGGTFASIGPLGQLQPGPSATLASSTAGSDFTITASGNVITYNLPSASAAARGLLTSSDFATFNNKVSSSSLSAVYPLAYNSSTGIFTTAFSTTTANTWSGINIFNGNVTFAQATSTSFFSTTASSTNLFASSATLSSLTAGDLILAGGPRIDIRSFGAVGNGVADDWSALNTATTTIGSVNRTLVISVPLLVTKKVSFPANINVVFERGGRLIGNAGSEQITFAAAPAQAGLYQIFQNVVVQYGFGGTIYPEWFGAVGDGSTNDRPAIQSAINALVNRGVVKLAAKYYAIDDQLIISNSYVSLLGDGQTATRLYVTGANKNGILLGSTANVSVPTVADLSIFHGTGGVSPCSSACTGIMASSTAIAKIHDVQVDGFLTGISLRGAGNTLLTNVESSYGGSANNFVGYDFDGSGKVGGNASSVCTNCWVSAAGSSGTGSIGFKLHGAYVSDLIFESPSTASANYGFNIDYSSVVPDNSADEDVEIRNPVIDQFSTQGIFVSGSSNESMLSIDGGWINPKPTGAETDAVYITSARGVTVSGMQFYADANYANAYGLKALNSSNVVVTGNHFVSQKYGVHFNNVTDSNVTSNRFFNIASKPATNDVSVFGGKDVIVSLNNFDGTAGIGAYFDSATANSSALGNISSSTVTTQVLNQSSSGVSLLSTKSGLFGIGTTSPNATLDVAGSFAIENGTPNQFLFNPVALGTLRFSGTAASNNLQMYDGVNSYLMDLYSGVSDNIRLYSAGDSWFNGGRLGIGTTTPVSKLTVYGGNGSPSLSSDTGLATLGSDTSVQLQFGAINSGSFPFWLQTKQNTNSGSAYPLALNPLGGNVGIGTTTPWAQLSINPNGITGPAFAIGSSTATSLVVTNGGNVGVGVSTPGYTMSIAGPTYIDTEGTWINRNAALTINRNIAAPVGIVPNVYSVIQGKGDNTTFKGVSGGFIAALDRSDVNASNKGVLYGLQISVQPTVARNNVPNDDVAAIVAQNDGTAKGTDGIYVGQNPAIIGPAWVSGILLQTNADYAYRAVGNFGYGLDFVAGTPATFTNAAIRIPNNTAFAARNAAGSADINLVKLNSSNSLSLLNDAAVVNSAGFFGIGTTSPQANLHVYGNAGNPSLSSDTGATAIISSASSVQLNMGSINASPYGFWLQTKQANNSGASFPLLLNPAGGNVGIGTTSPLTSLTVERTNPYISLNSSTLGKQSALLFYDNANLRWQFGNNYNNAGDNNIFIARGSGTGNILFAPDGNGNVGIGTTNPYSRLSVWGTDTASSTLAFNVINSASTTLFAVFDGGNAQLSGTLTQSSDRRLKTNIATLDASTSLAGINSLTPVAYDWLAPEKSGVRQYGFIAQDVQQVFPNLVATTSATALTPDGTLGLNYLGLIAPIVKAVQQLSADIASLASRISSLEAAVAGFANSFTTRNLCVADDSGKTCISRSQLQALLTDTPTVQISAPTPIIISGTTSPPSINIQGSNPATINVGDTYTDLGAIVHDNQGHDLSYRIFINSVLSGNILIDTSQVATDTIDYVATDTWGNTATSTRTVIVEAASSTTP